MQKEKGDFSRSAVLRDDKGCVQELLVRVYETTKSLTGNVVCTVTASYNHKGKHVDHDLLHLRYENEDFIKGNLYLHI